MMPAQDLDDFGLPIRQYSGPPSPADGGNSVATSEEKKLPAAAVKGSRKLTKLPSTKAPEDEDSKEKGEEGLRNRDNVEASPSAETDEQVFEDALSTPMPSTPANEPAAEPTSKGQAAAEEAQVTSIPNGKMPASEVESESADAPSAENLKEVDLDDTKRQRSDTTSSVQAISGPSVKEIEASKKAEKAEVDESRSPVSHSRDTSAASLSEFSHQQLTAHQDDANDDDDDGWQTMPSYAPYDIYDDDNKLIAREHNAENDEHYGYAGLGGAGKGYTRVVDDEDVESETSMDGDTKYLFNPTSTSLADDDEQRDAVSQMQATKDLLTEGQRIAYVGVTRLKLSEMQDEAIFECAKKTKKVMQVAAEATRMWSQKIMVRLYAHMEISPAEQIMIEQLVAHGVRPADLTPVLMQNARVKNPMAEERDSTPGTPRTAFTSPRESRSGTPRSEQPATAPPPYEAHAHDGEEMPEVKVPSQLPSTEKIDIDLRWTVLCDLFLVLIADSIYDARSRVLLERVGKDLEVPWIDICRFEKRVTDALEMQQAAEKENWNEEEHLENRRKLALKKRYVMMGLATVGGGLVIGLSAGLLAPLIGAGLAAGFTTIGVGGTSSFLAGAGGTAIITAGSAASGSFMGGKAASRRMGSVRTFEYRPLHNNKRVNLIVTISGWMTSKVDDVRLPFSTVDPLMGDIYSILWEPDMLTSMGDTINILATEVSRLRQYCAN